MAGRKPIPTVVKRIKGTLPKNHKSTEPMPAGFLAEAPSHLDQVAREAWEYAVANAPRHLLTRLDLSVLEVYACASSMYREAQAHILQEGMLVTTPNGMPMQSPYVTIANKQAMLILKACTEMGFTPASRARVSIEQEQEQDPWQEIAG